MPTVDRLITVDRLQTVDRSPLFSQRWQQMPILVMGEQWGDMILDGHKSIELRGKKNVKHANARVKVGVKGQCKGEVTVGGCFMYESDEQFRADVSKHRWNGDLKSVGYAEVWGWHLHKPEREKESAYQLARGCIGPFSLNHTWD